MMWQPVAPWAEAFAVLPVMTVGGRIVWLRKFQWRDLEYRYNDGHDHRRVRRLSRQYRLMPEEASMWPTPSNQEEQP